MNEQQLQQILAIQQAIAAAATAAVINSLLNPQQAAADALSDITRTDAARSDAATNDTISNDLQALQHQAAVSSPVAAPATSSNISQPTNLASPNKKLKTRHHHNAHQHQQHSFHNRSSDATINTTTSSSSSSTFLTNNVGLPRKLVRGQDVWLGRGAEQTRQILKCMWCGQSFRTLAEMTQHMKITQHYTNIISQEQITSWRQPENSDSNKSHGKQSASAHEELSEKLNDSDKEDSFSNGDDELRANRQHNDSNSTSESIQSQKQPKGSPSSKPLTRSRRRKTGESAASARPHSGDNSAKAPDERPKADSPGRESDGEPAPADKCAGEPAASESAGATAGDAGAAAAAPPTAKTKPERADDDNSGDNEHDAAAAAAAADDEHAGRISDAGGRASVSGPEDDAARSETNDASDAATPPALGAKGEAGDPLSALETMVEKSFDPRLRPGVANGGILQRLGIDEEVCPPWQNINYMNWYTAAAYGHPMAAALLAAGINLQNGIKLTKNMAPKKNDD